MVVMRTKMKGGRNKFQREKWTRQLSTYNFRRREKHQEQMQGLKLDDRHLKVHFVEVMSLRSRRVMGTGTRMDTLNLET